MTPPSVSLLAAGGTVSEVRDGRNLAGGATITAESLVRELPRRPGLPGIRPVNLPFRRSDDVTVTDIIELAAAVTGEISRGAAGVVITHGTDTLEETAFGLDLLLPPGAPVVVTGAMRPHADPGADGPANLVAALLVAAAPAARGLGALVVFGDTIHAARFARKSHTSSPGAAFASAPCGPIGWVAEGRVRIGCRPSRQHRIVPVKQDVPAVVIVKPSIGGADQALAGLASADCAGVIVEGFGGGHVPAALAGPLGSLAARLPVVITTRVAGGEVLRDTYGSAGDEVDLRARGLISGGILNSSKAHLALTLLLMSAAPGAWLREIFEDIASGCPVPPFRPDHDDQRLLPGQADWSP